MVGGVSIGAFMGALWCMEKDIHEVTRKASSWSHVRYLKKFRLDGNWFQSMPTFFMHIFFPIAFHRK